MTMTSTSPRSSTSASRRPRRLQSTASSSATETAEVVGDVSFSVHRGELFGLLGTNGAGKTTTVEILQGLRRRRSAATVRVLGLDPAVAGDRLRRRIGAQLQDAALPERMRVGEALRALRRRSTRHPARPTSSSRNGSSDRHPAATVRRALWRRAPTAVRRPRPRRPARARVPRRADPEPRPDRPAGTPGTSCATSVTAARRSCSSPTTSKRPSGCATASSSWTSGRVVADGTPARDRRRARRLRRRSASPTPSSTSATLRTVPGVTAVRRHGPEVHVEGSGPAARPRRRPPRRRRPPALDLRIQRPSLEDRFVALTERTLP